MTSGIALVGAGTVAELHLAALTATGKGHLAAVIDPNLAAARSVADRYGAALVAPELSSVLDRAEIDAVIIAAPTHLHHQLALQAIRAGKHVLVEKPLTASLPQADELVAAADAVGVTLVSGQVMRFMPMFEWARQFIADGGLGELVQVIERRLTHRDRTFAWWHGQPYLLVGHWGSHSLDLINHLTGAHPERVFCAAGSHLEAIDGVDDCTILTTLPGGARITSHFSFNARRELHDIVVVGTAATVEFDCYRSVSVNGRTVMQLSTDEMLARGFQNQLSDFLDGIGTGSCRADARSVLPSIAAISAAEQSLRTGAVATVEQARR